MYPDFKYAKSAGCFGPADFFVFPVLTVSRAAV